MPWVLNCLLKEITILNALLKNDIHLNVSYLVDPGACQNMIIKYLSVGLQSWFLYQQEALNLLFQMRYDSLPNSNKQPSDRQKALRTPIFTSKQDCFAYCFAQRAFLGSTNYPLHFGLSLSHSLEQIRPPYTIWKGTYLAFIWGWVACPLPRGCRDMASFLFKMAQASYTTPQSANEDRLSVYASHDISHLTMLRHLHFYAWQMWIFSSRSSRAGYLVALSRTICSPLGL